MFNKVVCLYLKLVVPDTFWIKNFNKKNQTSLNQISFETDAKILEIQMIPLTKLMLLNYNLFFGHVKTVVHSHHNIRSYSNKNDSFQLPTETPPSRTGSILMTPI